MEPDPNAVKGVEAVYNLTKAAYDAEVSRETLKQINLHFHDLRREAGSRWLEGRVPLSKVRDWLGHTNISQTSTYLSGTSETDADAMVQFERDRDARKFLVTEGRKPGSGKPRTAVPREEKPSKTGVGREPTIN